MFNEIDIQRFFGKIDFTGSCWQWMYSLDGKGYAQYRLDGKTVRGHRLAYKLLKANLVEGLDLDHLCRNRACVNPEHLEQVTRSTNLLRGELWQSKKTTCPRGHAYDLITERSRRCSKCTKHYANARQKRYYQRKQAVC